MVNNKIVKFLMPTIVAMLAYYVTNKFFPEKKEHVEIKNPDLRGGDLKLIKNWLKAVSNQRAIKIAIIAAFSTYGLNQFQDEIIDLLSSSYFINLCYNDNRLINDPICKLVIDNDLANQSMAIRKLILNNELTFSDKTTLLKIKIDSLLNCKYSIKKKFIVVFMVGIIISLVVSGSGGLTIILDALLRLFESGRIDQATYEYLKNRAIREAEKVCS